MILHILGSCSGTEPMPGRHHTSVALESGGKLYFLDAGEHCGYSSHLLGIDQLNLDSIFISHTHMDHIGGLPHLLWNVRKLTTLSPENQQRMEGRKIRVFLPNLPVFDGIYQMLLGSEGNYETVFSLESYPVADGVLLDEGITVTALHNYHLGEPAPGEDWKSFSFRINAEGQQIFYSGDFRDLSEILPLAAGSDLLMLETGHHRACDLCRELAESGVPFGNVLFFHHGRFILQDETKELALAREILGSRVTFAEDGTVVHLP
ncbi:MAG: MBL fold metallo-hydrolase [Candidatus Merdivicinus sp.]|jgi:ribonuclease BN (tRNA processing enzyme)